MHLFGTHGALNYTSSIGARSLASRPHYLIKIGIIKYLWAFAMELYGVCRPCGEIQIMAFNFYRIVSLLS